MSAKGLALGSSVGTFAHCVAVSARYSDGRSWNRQRAALLCTIGNAILGKGELPKRLRELFGDRGSVLVCQVHLSTGAPRVRMRW